MVRLGAQRFAIAAESVERMLRMAAFTSAPDLPAGVAGLLNLRGRTVPVVDPRPRLGLMPISPDPVHALLVSRTKHPFLLWVDAVEGTLEAGAADLEAVSVEGNSVPLTPALVRRPDGVLPVLALEALDPGALIGATQKATRVAA